MQNKQVGIITFINFIGFSDIIKNMKKHLFWIVELFIWLVILFVLSSTIMYAKYNYRRNFNTYQIFLPDVDGLINGSPVKIMGIQVGYVNQIDIVGEDVYVKFIVTQPDVKVPQGSIATVEFSGLGGSKSLEIYPPESEQKISDRILISQKPKRIHDSLGLLNDMFDKIIDLTYTVSRFMDKVGIIKSESKTHQKEVNHAFGKVETVTSANNFLDFSNNWLNKAQKQCEKFNKKMERIKNGKHYKQAEPTLSGRN